MTRVLVTGGSGAIGRHVVAEFARNGSTVISLDIRPPERSMGENVMGLVGDVRDSEQMTRLLVEHQVNVVVHLAAALPVLANRDLAAAMDINVRGAQAVAEACAAAGTTALVHFSSKAVYGRPGSPYSYPDYAPVPEWAPRNPVDNYGISKLAGESTVRALAEELRLPTHILRLGGTFGTGKGERHGTLSWLSELVDAALAGRTVIMDHAPGASVDLIYNADVGRAAVAAATKLLGDPRPQVVEINIASGIAIPVEQVGLTLERIAGRALIRSDGGRPSQAESRIVVPATGVVLDTRSARDGLGFSTAFDLEAGLRAFLEESSHEGDPRKEEAGNPDHR